MLFYYVQINLTDLIPGVNIRGKASIESINKAGGSGGWVGRRVLKTLSRDFRG